MPRGGEGKDESQKRSPSIKRQLDAETECNWYKLRRGSIEGRKGRVERRANQLRPARATHGACEWRTVGVMGGRWIWCEGSKDAQRQLEWAESCDASSRWEVECMRV